MLAAEAHSWTFRSRFRAGAFGWRSDLPIKRIKEAVAEIKKATRKDEVLGAEGAMVFLEKVSGALEHVDSSSGAIGAAVNRAIETLVPIVAQARASNSLRDEWLELPRLHPEAHSVESGHGAPLTLDGPPYPILL